MSKLFLCVKQFPSKFFDSFINDVINGSENEYLIDLVVETFNAKRTNEDFDNGVVYFKKIVDLI